MAFLTTHPQAQMPLPQANPACGKPGSAYGQPTRYARVPRRRCCLDVQKLLTASASTPADPSDARMPLRHRASSFCVRRCTCTDLSNRRPNHRHDAGGISSGAPFWGDTIAPPFALQTSRRRFQNLGHGAVVSFYAVAHQQTASKFLGCNVARQFCVQAAGVRLGLNFAIDDFVVAPENKRCVLVLANDHWPDKQVGLISRVRQVVRWCSTGSNEINFSTV